MADPIDDPPPAGTRPRSRMAIGAMLSLIPVLVVSWLAWQSVGSGLWARHQHTRQIAELRSQWDQAYAGAGRPVDVRPGEAYAILSIAEFGDDHAVPVIAGTEAASLARGVGSYSSSTPPGVVGNLAIAGHRTSHGAPFGPLLTLNRGDEIVIETREAVYVYLLDIPPREVTVRRDDAWVLDPVPGAATDDPTQPTLTLTTNQDLVRSIDRSIAFGHLGSTRIK